MSGSWLGSPSVMTARGVPAFAGGVAVRLLRCAHVSIVSRRGARRHAYPRVACRVACVRARSSCRRPPRAACVRPAMPYASASGRPVNGLRTGCPADDGRTAGAGKNERGDMTRLRGTLPPVVSAMRLLPVRPGPTPSSPPRTTRTGDRVASARIRGPDRAPSTPRPVSSRPTHGGAAGMSVDSAGMAARLGIKPGMVVQELGWDEDADEDLRDADHRGVRRRDGRRGHRRGGRRRPPLVARGRRRPRSTP